MSSHSVQDQAAREAIRTRLDETFLVEAGAGSGKTTSLVQRMAALIITGTCQIERLAAVTFTRKAAAELRERFQEELERSYLAETEAVKRARLAAALANLHRAFIGTIHSFCSRILRERPVEAGMSPDFTEIEGLEERLLYETAWEEYLLEVRLLHPQRLQAIRSLDVTPEELKTAYLTLLLYPDVNITSTAAPYPDLAPAKEALEMLLLTAKQRLPEQPPAKGWDDLQKVLRQALRWQSFFDLDQDRNLLRLLQRLDKEPRQTLNRWPEAAEAKDLRQMYLDFRQQVLQPTLQAWRGYRYAPLLEFLRPAVTYCENLRKRENKLNFQDLLMRTAQLLKSNTEVRAYFRARFTHILVDEFQDTDPIQAEIMLYLTSTATHSDWTQLTIQPGALFVVGDPKQSIYRFRRADIDIYNLMKERITASEGEVLHLTANFRSLTEIIDWVNPVFKTLLSQDAAPYQAAPIAMHTVHTANVEDSKGLFTIEIPKVSYHKKDEIAELDANKIAAWIRYCIDGGITITTAQGSKTPTSEDFLILVRYKDNITQYARALERFNIRFTLSGGGDITSSPELRELYLLLQTLADPANPVPLVATLRGLFYGLSDQELYQFKKAGGHFNFLTNLSVEAPTCFVSIWEKLQQYYSWSQQLPPSTALEKIISELGLIPYALANQMGKGRTGYILQLLELVRQREIEGHAQFSATLDYITELLENGTEEEIDLQAGQSPGVRIMNLHKAKGLEAPIVFLANPGKKATHEPDLHVSRTAGLPTGYLTIHKKSNFRSQILAQPLMWQTYQAEESRYQEAEEMRLLYVAATRAKNMLIISTYAGKPENSPWHPFEQFLENMPELTIPAVEVPTATVPAAAITPELLRQTQQEIKDSTNSLMTHTYQRQTVTELVKAGPAPERYHTGRGMSWGNVVHKALEALIRSNETVDLDVLIPQLLSQEGRAAAEKQEIITLLQKVTNTPLWQRLRKAKEKYTEVPFGVFKHNTYLTGTIDVAFKEDDGWVLLDFKSDAIKDDHHLEQLKQYYAPQMQKYCKHWQELSGERVKECGILFVSLADYL